MIPNLDTDTLERWLEDAYRDTQSFELPIQWYSRIADLVAVAKAYWEDPG